MLAHSPGKWNAAEPVILALIQQGKTAEALDVVNRTAKGGTRTPLAPYYRGRILAAAGDLAGASAAFSEALDIAPKFAPARYFRAHVEAARGDPAAAEKDLKQMIAQNPADASAYLALAEIALHEGDEPRSIALLNTAIKAAPKDPAPRLALALTQTFLRKFSDAEATLDALLKIWPGNPEALKQLGRVRLLRGDKAKAVETYLGLAAAYPNSSGAYVLLAKVFHATNDPVGAVDAAKKAAEFVSALGSRSRRSGRISRGRRKTRRSRCQRDGNTLRFIPRPMRICWSPARWRNRNGIVRPMIICRADLPRDRTGLLHGNSANLR